MIGATENRTSKVLALASLLVVLTAACLLLITARPAHAATFTVNSTGDADDNNPGDGSCFTGVVLQIGDECTLRAAIEEANAASTADTISFDIPGTGVNTISPATALPEITSPVTIDGYSQPGAKPNTLAVGNDAVLKIELSGAASAPGSAGLRITAANSTIKGLVINRWADGVSIREFGAKNNKIMGNYIGTDPSGKGDLGNGRGVEISATSNNIIGGTKAAERNVISGNGVGVDIFGIDATGNEVVGNYIGTDVSGKVALGNGEGVSIDASNNTIGGTKAAARNVISGNGLGVIIAGTNTTGNIVMGNYIGTDASGTQDLGNGDEGVFIFDAPNNTIGGTKAAARNVISGNDELGVLIEGVDATGNKVIGNYVGTDKDGAADLGNDLGVLIHSAPNNTIGGTKTTERNVISGNHGTSGVFIFDSGATGNRVVGNYIGTKANGIEALGNVFGVIISSAADNTVGGTQAGAGNTISGNDEDGVVVTNAVATATGNSILSNSISINTGLGIDLGFANGVTANDPGDADAGPNNLQNFPDLTRVKKSGKKKKKKIAIEGTLNSSANTAFTIQFFSSPEVDPSGNGEGQRFLGSKSVTTDASGNATFAFKTRKKGLKRQVVSATATNETTGDTSEFSGVVPVS